MTRAAARTNSPSAITPAMADAQLAVREMTVKDSTRWDEFVRTCPSATFFHFSKWKRVIEEVFRHQTWFLYAEEQGRIRGILPLAQVRSRFFGHSLVSLPFCVYGGVATLDSKAGTGA